MRSYELMLVIKPDLTEADVKKVSSEIIKGLNKKAKSNEDFWGKRKLAYPMQKYTEAFYTVLNFESEPEFAAKLKTELNLNSSVLRYLLTASK